MACGEPSFIHVDFAIWIRSDLSKVGLRHIEVKMVSRYLMDKRLSLKVLIVMIAIRKRVMSLVESKHYKIYA